jgi:uncharacterized protein YkwD
MVVAVLVFSWRWLTLAPVPRAVELGATLELKGHLLYDLSAAQLVVSYPDGSSTRGDAQSGAAISQRVVTRGSGEHRIELLASSARGDTVVANFPVYVGVPPPSEITLQAEPGGAELDAAQSGRRLLELINDARKRVGIAPIAADEHLAAVALAHSQDMQQHGFVGHTSPTTGNAEDRARRAGIRTPLVLENIGRGYSPDEVHRGLMESPGHRENVLNPQATHVGIGVVLAAEDQRTAYLATELFARFATVIDVGEAPTLWLDAVNRARARRGARPLVQDKVMAQLCQQAAEDFFRAPGKSRQAIVEDLNRKAASTHPGYVRLGALLTLVSSLDEGTQLDALLDPKARAVGMGVAQGTRADTVENAIALVALVGR